MELTVLGCTGSYPAAGDVCSGYLVRASGMNVWLDAGPGSLARLQEHVDLDALDAVIVTHAHPDHWSDLLSWHIAVKYLRQRSPVPVFSPVRVRELLQEVNGPIGKECAWEVVGSGDRTHLGPLTFSFNRTDHGPETLAVRIEDGNGVSMGYSADTGAAWSFERLGDDLDLALCEASLTTEEEGRIQHLSGRQAGDLARQARAARLVVTHFPPGVDPVRQQRDAAEAFGAPVDRAEAGATFTVSR